jgi:hypothetical protein
MKSFIKAVGIGALAGYCTLFSALLLFYIIILREYFDPSYLILGGILSTPAIPLGIITALVGWYWRKTSRATWIGGIVGGLTGILTLYLIALSGNGCFLIGGC